MTRLLPRLLLLIGFALGAGLRAWARSATQISPEAPILNFRLPTFTPDGHREWLIRGSQVFVSSRSEIRVQELSLTIYSGDTRDRIVTLLLSPLARVDPESRLADGDEALRIIHEDYEASGLGWSYDHKAKKVSLLRRARVTMHLELKDLLQ